MCDQERHLKKKSGKKKKKIVSLFMTPTKNLMRVPNYQKAKLVMLESDAQRWDRNGTRRVPRKS